MAKFDLKGHSPMSSTATPRTTGTVKFFDNVKGWGFLVEDNTQRDVFVHWKQMWYDKTKDCPRFELEEGQRVEFEVREEAKGLQAFEVVVLED